MVIQVPSKHALFTDVTPNSSEAVVMLNSMFEQGPLHGVTTPSFPDVRSNQWAEEAATTYSFYTDENGKEYVVK